MSQIELLAKAVEKLAVLLELEGQNTFKINAHHNLVRLLQDFSGSLEEFIEQARAGSIKGVGKGLLEKVEQFFSHGEISELRDLQKSYPPGIFDLLKVPSLGPKKLKTLYQTLSIASLPDLQKACEQGTVAGLPGFGEKTQTKLLEGVKRIQEFADLFLFSEAERQATPFAAYVKLSAVCDRVEILGSLRRCKEIVHDIDFLAVSAAPQELMAHFVAYPEVLSITAQGETKSSVVLKSGLSVDLRVVSKEEYPAAVVYFTGSKEHNTELRGRAHRMGYKLNEYGLFKGEKPVTLREENDVYTTLGLCYIPPELREGHGEIERAEELVGQGFPQLIELNQLKGIIHCHSTYSDGRSSVREMALAARERGYQYLGMSDHSQSARYAGGMSIEAVSKQHDEIDCLNEELKPFRILKGIESDILVDGSLDYPDAVLERFDFVIASVHDHFSLKEREMTDRIIRALENPFTTILGHMTGRLLLQRDGYALRIEDVLERAAALGKAIELNASPQRLDIDWRWLGRARALGIKIPINPDAHSVEGLDYVRFGVGVARKGGLCAEDVPNCLGLEAFMAWLGD